MKRAYSLTILILLASMWRVLGIPVCQETEHVWFDNQYFYHLTASDWESFETISMEYGVRVSVLKRENKALDDKANLQEGVVVRIPLKNIDKEVLNAKIKALRSGQPIPTTVSQENKKAAEKARIKAERKAKKEEKARLAAERKAQKRAEQEAEKARKAAEKAQKEADRKALKEAKVPVEEKIIEVKKQTEESSSKDTVSSREETTHPRIEIIPTTEGTTATVVEPPVDTARSERLQIVVMLPLFLNRQELPLDAELIQFYSDYSMPYSDEEYRMVEEDEFSSLKFDVDSLLISDVTIPDSLREEYEASLMELSRLDAADTVLINTIVQSLDTLEIHDIATSDDHWSIYPPSRSIVHFLQGILFAVQDLSRLGYDIDLHIFDTERSVERVIAEADAVNRLRPDLIIGPAYADTYRAMASALADKSVPMVYPLSTRTEDLSLFPNFVQANPSTPAVMEEMADWVASDTVMRHIVWLSADSIAPSEHEAYFRSLLEDRLPMEQLDSMRTYQWEPSVVNIDSLKPFFIDSIPNLVIIPSVSQAVVSQLLPSVATMRNPLVISLDSMNYDVTTIGFPEWPHFNTLDPEVIFRSNLYLMSNTDIRFGTRDERAFAARYSEVYYTMPELLSYKGFDIASYFISLVAQNRGRALEALPQTDYDGPFMRFHFVHTLEGLGWENRGLYELHYLPTFRINQELHLND